MLFSLPTPFFASELPIKAPVVFNVLGLPITNSMIAALIVCVLVILVASYACRQIKLIPDDDQNVWEVIVEWLLELCEPILGEKGAKKTFWFFAAIFIFIVSSNLFALIPFTGSWGNIYGTSQEAVDSVPVYHRGFEAVYHEGHGDHEASGYPGVVKFIPWLRGTNADVNMVFAMAAWFMILWAYWSISELGFGGFIHHIFGPKANMGIGGFVGFLVAFAFFIIFLFVGFIEVISIAFRPISLGFRLFGNIYGGEAMLEALYVEAGPYLAALVWIPAYLFELLVAIVQALVFCLLTAAFTGTMIKHDDHHGDGEHAETEATPAH